MKAIINENKTITISNADIKAIRSAAGFNTDLRHQLKGFNGRVSDWLDDHAAEIFGEEIESIKAADFTEYEKILWRAAQVITGETAARYFG